MIRSFQLMKRHLIIILAFLLTFSSQTIGAEEERSIKTVALIPFDNLSGEDLTLDFTQALYDHLQREGFEVISQDTLEQFFIRRRIRSTISINRAIVRELGETLGADALILGSINLLSRGDNPKVDVSAQMVDAFDSSIVWVKSVSYSGDDFATFLGIGKITSLEKLVEIAIKDLLNDMPAFFKKKEEKKNGMIPFEVVQASFFPKVVKGGGLVGLMIEVRQITGRSTYLSAIVQDKNVPLVSDGARWYRGSFTSPRAEGLYPLKLYAAGEWNKLFFFDAMANLIVDNTPPVVALAARSTLISPNNDGINDYAIFFPTLLATDKLKEWRFEIKDRDGKLVRYAEGRGGLPKGLTWRGENNAFKLVGDGTYFGQLIIEDEAGHEVATEKVMIMVDRTFPEVEIVPDKTDKDDVLFSVKSTDASKIVEWNITIYDQNDEVLGTFSGKHDLPSTLRCAAKKRINTQKDTFTYSLEIRDAAGNMLTVEKQSMKSKDSRETPDKTSEEKKERQWIEDF